MQLFTGYEYLLIDIANNAGLDLDKALFPARIEWVNTNMTGLEGLYQSRDWKERPLYVKAVQALRRVQSGKPSGHMVGFDAINSGMQIMSATTGCITGAAATGLVHQDVRSDAYTECTNIMMGLLPTKIEHARQKMKDAVMTALYGSKAEPERVFGKDTPELEAFWKALDIMAPGACELLNDLLESWQAYALVHEWILPDGYHARVKVMQQKEKRIRVEELNDASFTYTYWENEGELYGVKNPGNVTHSLDAYLLRTLIRRCSYDTFTTRRANQLITDCLLDRSLDHITVPAIMEDDELAYYVDHYNNSGMADITLIDLLTPENVRMLSTAHLTKLNKILNGMLVHKPFPVITVHDDFKCHPNNMNALRFHYKEILADMADSKILSDIFSQIHGQPVVYQKLSDDLGDTIRNANYHLS